MTLKRPPSVKTYSVPLYGGSVWLATSITDATTCAAILGIDPDFAGSDGICFDWRVGKKGRVCLVCVFDDSFSTLIHELSHATFRILGCAGIKVSDDSEEAFCYLLGHLVSKLHA